ncbi:indole-3-glycerol phosphate synthase TrpC [soil metagenome]
MNILDKIVEHKRKEVEVRKRHYPVSVLERSSYFGSRTHSMKLELQRDDKSGIIAEFKRKSPSKGEINFSANIEETSMGYVKAGAIGLSVLTDDDFFGGRNQDLIDARNVNSCPILRKDFIIDEYQILEAKSIGADVILLIAAILDPSQLREYCSLAHSLKLEVLMEVHDETEYRNNEEANVDIVGVNNRNLKTFEVSTEVSKRLSLIIPDSTLKISESGIDSPEVIVDLKKSGFRGFLLGQTFMEKSDPAKEAGDFIKRLMARTKINEGS